MALFFFVVPLVATGIKCPKFSVGSDIFAHREPWGRAGEVHMPLAIIEIIGMLLRRNWGRFCGHWLFATISCPEKHGPNARTGHCGLAPGRMTLYKRYLVTALQLRDIYKRYGLVQAVRGASLTIKPGRIHTVIGQNGAGKSTFLKIAAGVIPPDSGTILIDDVPVAPYNAAIALTRGIGIVQQHFALVEVFTAVENVILGVETVDAVGRLKTEAARSRIASIASHLGVALPLDVPVGSLGVGDRQRLEIIRALYRNAQVLILDEPTAVLAPSETAPLYALLRKLADEGRAIVVVTHKLDEVQAHADTVTVMRHGVVVETRDRIANARSPKAQEEIKQLSAAMMGGELPTTVPRAEATKGTKQRRLIIEQLARAPDLVGVDLVIHDGEVVGVAGIEGNGQRELVEVLGGLENADAGVITVVGQEQPNAIVIYEDRHRDGLVLDATVEDNLVLGELKRFSRAGVIDFGKMADEAARRLASGGVVPAELSAKARDLSGGNQQKIVVARAIARVMRGDSSVLVMSHPTRGVDLGAAAEIHEQTKKAADRGAAVLVVSSDLNELRTLCDRILVMTRGKFVAEFAPTASDAEIGAAMLAVGLGGGGDVDDDGSIDGSGAPV